MGGHSRGPWRSGRQDMVSYTLEDAPEGGPWKNIYRPERPGDKRHSKFRTVLPALVARAYGDTEKECLANARLIAAAPEMLEALTRLLAATYDTNEYDAAENQASALIRRIRGDEPERGHDDGGSEHG